MTVCVRITELRENALRLAKTRGRKIKVRLLPSRYPKEKQRLRGPPQITGVAAERTSFLHQGFCTSVFSVCICQRGYGTSVVDERGIQLISIFEPTPRVRRLLEAWPGSAKITGVVGHHACRKQRVAQYLERYFATQRQTAFNPALA